MLVRIQVLSFGGCENAGPGPLGHKAQERDSGFRYGSYIA